MDKISWNIRTVSHCSLILAGTLFAVLCIFSVSMAEQEQPTATITNLTGSAVVSVQGKEAEAEVEMVLTEGDTIQTQAGAEVTLTLSDGSVIQLGENTQTNIDVLFQSPEGARKSRLKLLYGQIRAILSLGHQKKGSDFTVETPNAQVGVKFSKPDVEVMYDPETKTTVARGYTVGMSVTNTITRAKAGDIPKEHQVIVHKAMIVVTKITDIPKIIEQMRDIPEIGRPQVPEESPEATMDLLLETRENIGMITPVTSQVPTPGTRTDAESGPEPVEFTYTININ